MQKYGYEVEVENSQICLLWYIVDGQIKQFVYVYGVVLSISSTEWMKIQEMFSLFYISTIHRLRA